MLALYLKLKDNNPEDKKRFDRIKQAWSKWYVEPKVKQIRDTQTNERITIENGQRYFACHTWLKAQNSSCCKSLYCRNGTM